MKRSMLSLTVAALFAASTAAYAADNNGSSNQHQQQQSQQQQQQSQQGAQGQQGNSQQAPKGFVLLEENTVYMMAREPQQHLLRAHEQLAANNPKAAAAELRLADAYLKMQEARSGNVDKGVLSHWQEQLKQLADRVQKGDAKEPEVTHASAGANYALAKYFDERARSELGDKGKQVQAGYDLQAAADCFEQALIWHDTGMPKDQQTQPQAAQQDAKAIADARLAADQLISADNLASNGSSGGAQPAAAKSGPSAGNNKGQSADPQKAAEELSKSISACADKFGTQQGQQQKSSDSQQKASSK